MDVTYTHTFPVAISLFTVSKKRYSVNWSIVHLAALFIAARDIVRIDLDMFKRAFIFFFSSLSLSLFSPLIGVCRRT